MDHERFLRVLPTLFEDFPHSEHPRDRRFAPILDRVENLASENVLALLNLAASCLGPDEAYVEIGVFHGASLAAAMLGQSDGRFVAIDDFSFDGTSREDIQTNLEHFGLALPELVVGDVFERVRSGALDGIPVGVWYYDASHSYEAQLEGLRIAEPFLVPGALLVVDDTDWEKVERALDDYLAEQPRAREIVSVDGRDRGAPQWWAGMRVFVWDV
ncbi:MAG TPA: class I SAM-dependent methyltransferase [Gaiellaceae bacterium]|nr:class I SAM-dependent methyltransferase [Gaiellaceae bacterium]